MEVSFDRPSSGSNVEDVLVLDEKRKALMNAIRELPILDRQLVTLHLEGLSAAEIEEVTGVSQGAIATRLTRIRQRLATRVQTEGVRHA